jgi:hypothetical protein
VLTSSNLVAHLAAESCLVVLWHRRGYVLVVLAIVHATHTPVIPAQWGLYLILSTSQTSATSRANGSPRLPDQPRHASPTLDSKRGDPAHCRANGDRYDCIFGSAKWATVSSQPESAGSRVVPSLERSRISRAQRTPDRSHGEEALHIPSSADDGCAGHTMVCRLDSTAN